MNSMTWCRKMTLWVCGYIKANTKTETTCLTPFGPVTHFGVLCKQCRPSSDAAKCGILSGSTLFAYRKFFENYVKNDKMHQKLLKLEMDSSKWPGWIHLLVKNGYRYHFEEDIKYIIVLFYYWHVQKLKVICWHRYEFCFFNQKRMSAVFKDILCVCEFVKQKLF